MGGMCAGQSVAARISVSRRRHPLRVYRRARAGDRRDRPGGVIRLPHVEEMYTRYSGHGLPGILLRGGVAGCACCRPRCFSGATLPAIARWVESGPDGVSWLGFFYGGNIAGAVFGCLLAGFYLLRVYDMATATYVAVAFNATVAVIALALAPSGPVRGSGGTDATASADGAPRALWSMLSGDRTLRDGGARGRGRLDPAVVAGVGRDGLHVFVDSGRVFDWTGDRQQRLVRSWRGGRRPPGSRWARVSGS